MATRGAVRAMLAGRNANACWLLRAQTRSGWAVPRDASRHKQGVSSSSGNSPLTVGAANLSSSMAQRSQCDQRWHGVRCYCCGPHSGKRAPWCVLQHPQQQPHPRYKTLQQPLRRYHHPSRPPEDGRGGGFGEDGHDDDGGDDDDMAQLTDDEVEDMLQMSQLPMFLPTVENRPPPSNSLEVLRNLSPMAFFSWLHRGAFDANDFVAGVKLALPELGHAIRDRDLQRLDVIAAPPFQDNIKLTFEVMQHAGFEYDIEEVNRVRLDCVHVEDMWSRDSPLAIDVWADVTERFVVARLTDGTVLHPRMHRPFRCVRRYRFASTPGDETTRTWFVEHMLGPKGFPPQSNAKFWF